MKSAFLLMLLSSFGFCVYSQNDLDKFDWLQGTWTRTNAKPGRSGVEIWQKRSDSEMTGQGISLKGSDTTFVEKLKIIMKDDAIYYVADVPENKEPILFKLTSHSKNRLVFENPQHDFPKKITYELLRNKLKATTAGDGKEIEFWFEKK